MEILMGIILFVLGLCLGSFVNMLGYRTAKKYQILKSKSLKVENEQRSYCDFCGRQLNWYENVPVVSWVIQKGRTRCCGNPLPWEYPVVELGMGLLMILVTIRITEPLQIILAVVLLTLLLFSFVFDLKYMILPDFSTFILIGVAFLGVVFDEKNILPYLLSAAGACLFLLFLNIITKGKGMGMGDVKYAIFIGLLLGFPLTVLAMYIAFIGGAMVGVFLILNKKLKRKSLIPFGPFLIIGTVVAWWWGGEIVKILNSKF